LFLTWELAEVCYLVRKSYSYVARVLPFYADLEVVGGADRRVLEAEKVRELEAFVDTLRELTRVARAGALQARAGAA
jgi:hypothetical protein